MELFLFLFLVILLFFAVLLPILALIEVFTNELRGNNKLIWVLVILFFPLLGAILYFFLGRQQRIVGRGRR